jgi:hypothetical protein
MIQEVTTAHDRDAQKRLKSLPINFAFFLRRSDIDPMPQKSFDDIAFAALRAIGHTCGREVILRNPKTGSEYGSPHPLSTTER